MIPIVKDRSSQVITLDKVVLGGDLSSFIFAYLNKLPIVCPILNQPFFYETFEEETPLGYYKHKMWDKLCIYLSLAGLMPFGSTVQNINIFPESNKFTVSTTEMNHFTIKYNHLYVLEDRNIIGLPAYIDDKEVIYEVVDDFMCYRVDPHNYEELYDEEGNTFVEKILFYEKEMDFVETKNFFAISKLTEAELQDRNFDETMARLKCKRMLKKANVQGDIYRIYTNGVLRTGRRNPQVKHQHRFSRPITKHIYENTNNITFINSTVEELCKEYPNIFKEKYRRIWRLIDYGSTRKS